MQVTVQRISPVLMEFQVEVPAESVRAEVEKAYMTLSKKAHIKGFRPGKAPRDVLKRLYGQQVQSDVMNALVNDTLPKALNEKSVTPINQPSVVEAGDIQPTTAFSYKARFEVQPDIEDAKYEGFELYRPKAEVKDSEVDEQIEGLRKAHSQLKAPEAPRPSKSGDVVTIDFTLEVGGSAVKDGGGQGIQIEIGAGQALPELDAALIGKSAGDAFDVQSPFPDNHPRKDFQGKTGTFHVTLSDVKEKVLPAIDDEFAKDVSSQFTTLVELRADIHTKLEKAHKDRQETAVAEQIVTKLNEANPCEVPPSLVEQQSRIMEQEVAMSARRMGQRFSEEQAKSIVQNIRIDAERKVRAGLVMAAIARKNEFKVTDDDMEKGIQELAQETGKNVAKVRVEYREKSKRDILIGMILEDKILDFIESKSKIVDGDPPAAAVAVEAKADVAEGAKPEKAKAKKAEKKEEGK